MTLKCTRSKSCKCYWLVSVFEKKVNLQRCNTPTHDKELKLKKRNKMTHNQASITCFNVELFSIVTFRIIVHNIHQ